MCKKQKNELKELFNASIPSPKEISTDEILLSNGRISLLKKTDGTFCLKNEIVGCQHGHFLTKKEAEEYWKEIVVDDNTL